MSKSKAKGTSFESLIKNYLLEEGFDADRQILSGAKDIGDIKIYGVDAVFELKNCMKLNLSGWITETETERQNAKRKFGFTIFKRKGKGKAAEQFALMPLETLVELLKIAYPHAVVNQDPQV
jgi:hypothetical protein